MRGTLFWGVLIIRILLFRVHQAFEALWNKKAYLNCLVLSKEWGINYLWLVGNGGMGYNYNYYSYHSSIPY